MILAAGEEEIVPILGRGITSQVLRELRKEENREPQSLESVSQANLFQFGENRE
jgi:hypothetical protein